MWKKKGTIKCDKRIVTYDIITASCEDGTVKCEKKKNHQMWKSTIKCDIGTTQYKDETVKYQKK